jgi:anti-anti-sigma regulatory factor
MEITESQETGSVPITILHLHGDLLHEEPLLARARQAVESGTRYLLLDLEGVDFISSAGLRGLHEVHNLFRGHMSEAAERALRRDITTGAYKSPHLKLLRPSRNGLKALKVAGYDMFLDIFQQRSEAVAAFAG